MGWCFMNKFGFGLVPDELKLFPRISATKLIDFIESPMTYCEKHLKGENEQTKAMLEGQIVHEMLLEAPLFNLKYVMHENVPDHTVVDLKAICGALEISDKGLKFDIALRIKEVNPDFKTKILFEKEVEESGKIVISEKLTKALNKYVPKIKEDTFLRNILTSGEKEKLGYFFDEPSQVVITFKADWFSVDLLKNKAVCVDLKRFSITEPKAFSRNIFYSNLHVQAAIYCDAIKTITGLDTVFAWGCLENDMPWAVDCYAADNAMIEAGRHVYRSSLMRFAECHKNNYWPSHAKGKVMQVALPAFAYQQIDEEFPIV